MEEVLDAWGDHQRHGEENDTVCATRKVGLRRKTVTAGVDDFTVYARSISHATAVKKAVDRPSFTPGVMQFVLTNFVDLL